MKPVALACGVSFVLLLTQGCRHRHGRPFENSSADFNQGLPHTMRCNGELEVIADAVVTVMDSNGAMLVRRRDTERGSIVLSFKRELERLTSSKTRNRGTTWAPVRSSALRIHTGTATTSNKYSSYGSFLYVELTPVAEAMEIQAIGLPFIDRETACPPAIKIYRDCQPAKPTTSVSFASEIQKFVGVSVNGQVESELIDSLFAHLRRKSWQDKFQTDPVREKALPADDGGSAIPAPEESSRLK